jgi:hypothetical protein
VLTIATLAQVPAKCRRVRHVSVIGGGLPLPTPLPTGGEWIYAYRHWLS